MITPRCLEKKIAGKEPRKELLLTIPSGLDIRKASLRHIRVGQHSQVIQGKKETTRPDVKILHTKSDSLEWHGRMLREKNR